jgi:N,N'-diacetyllegionaminate synthase
MNTSKNPIIIAEVGHNHNGNMNLAKAMIWEAKSCGADIVKFQLYDTDSIKKYYQSRYSELKWAELSRNDLEELYRESEKAEIEFMASAFDVERVAWLEELGVKRHKIASRSIFDKELRQCMVETGKPIIASLGQWRMNEFPIIKNTEFLYCVSDYPAVITELPSFDTYSGFSDHSIGIEWAKEAIRKGAEIIEKHFTLDKKLPGYDQWGSADPTDLKDLVKFKNQWIQKKQ